MATVNYQSFSLLDQFLEQVDSGRLFDQPAMTSMQQLRADLVQALNTLLIWKRPMLEKSRGIQWPYEALAQRRPMFQDIAKQDPDSPSAYQARLFLSLLPFPDQWKWLEQTCSQLSGDPELKRFLAQEQTKIQDKLKKKAPKKFQLHRFCQILKAPRDEEKGVLRIFAMPYLLTQGNVLAAIAPHYLFYVEPPMGVNFRHTWLRKFAFPDNPVLVGVGSIEDETFIHSQSGFAAIRLAHGDFLDPRPSVPLNQAKTYDIVFNATFDDMPRKRHELMLDLLTHPLLTRKSALFLGLGSHGHLEQFDEMVRKRHLQDRVRRVSNLRREQVPEYIATCRMGVHLSLYENACRSIYEFFRSDLPCVISSSMAGMNPDIFNRQTGVMAPDDLIAETIAHVLDNLDAFSPRKWFLTQSGSDHSSQRLNGILKQICTDWGLNWSKDIVPLTSGGAHRYLTDQDLDRFRPAYHQLMKIIRSAHPSTPIMGIGTY